MLGTEVTKNSKPWASRARTPAYLSIVCTLTTRRYTGYAISIKIAATLTQYVML